MKRSILASVVAQHVLSSAGIGDGEGGVQLGLSYPSADAIPEGFGALYTERDGAMHLTNIQGMKTQDDINRLQSALNKERSDHKAVKDTFARLGDRSVDDILGVLDKVPAWEAMEAGNDPEQINKLVDAKLAQSTAPLERSITSLTEERDGYKGKFDALVQEVNNDKIIDHLKTLALKANVLPDAIEDVARMGLPLFERTETGEIVVKADATGATPGVTADLWLNDLKETRAFYWPASQGAGGQGGRGGDGSGGDNPFTKGKENYTKQGQLIQTDPDKAARLAKAAGVKPYW